MAMAYNYYSKIGKIAAVEKGINSIGAVLFKVPGLGLSELERRH